LLVVNPNNPTGCYLSEEAYAALTRICAENQLALICDEVFSDYDIAPDPGTIRSVAGRADVLTFALSGLSKVCALPQMKLGWIAVSGPQAVVESAMKRLEWIADAFLSPGAPVQWAAASFLGSRHSMQEQIRRRTRRNLSELLSRTAGSPVRVLKVEGGWYTIVQVARVRSEEEWILELLRRHGVLVQPGYFYDFESEAYLVLSLLTEPYIFDTGVRALLHLASAPD
jgi:aspartate/methionine/tyrosine aminotransferase